MVKILERRRSGELGDTRAPTGRVNIDYWGIVQEKMISLKV